MSENKFIRHLQGKDTAKSVLEIKNQNTPTSFANMPAGTSNANDVYSDPRGDAVGVLKGSENWKLDGQNLVDATTVYGDGRDLTTTYQASGATLWVNSTYTFSSAKRFNPNTKFILKLCGHSLDSDVDAVVDFSLIITFGNTIITKTFRESIYAFNFCKEFVIDFAESNQNAIKVDANDTMQVQLLCSDATASAVIYNGMTVFTALQRRVDGDTVASDKKTFDEVVQDIDDINEEIDDIHEDIDDLEDYVDDTFVRLDGTSIMTAPLKFMSGSVRGAVGPYFNGVGFWKISAQGVLTQIASLSDSQFIPTTTNAIDVGSSSKKWKNLYLAGKLYVATINNGGDLVVPAVSGTLATKADVDLAANSGSQLYTTGVWYAKMYSATVVPTGSEYDGKNYADFSQVDNDNNPIIVIYEGQSGAWVELTRITPPDSYNGYVTVTSKIWDIPEQTDQQGGQILWSFNQKTFTPYPRIVSVVTSLEDLTDVTLNSPSANQVLTYNGTSWTNQSITFPTINYSINGGNYTAGTGSYAITRFSLMLQKADGTWEKPTDTSVTYSQATNKTVNTNGFLLNQILYYNYTGTVSSGQLTGLNRVYSKHAFVPMSYSTNCGTAPGWALGTWIYLVGTLGADGLFYLDTTQWWSDALPNSADGKLYIRLGPASSGTSDTVVLLEDRPIFYHDGVEVKEYIVGVSNKADTDLSNVSQTGKSAAIGWLMPDYSQGQNVALTGITQWEAPVDCFVSYQSGLKNGAQESLSIGNVRVCLIQQTVSSFVYTTVGFYMKAGQILTGLAPNDTNRDSTIYYFPLGA